MPFPPGSKFVNLPTTGFYEGREPGRGWDNNRFTPLVSVHVPEQIPLQPLLLPSRFAPVVGVSSVVGISAVACDPAYSLQRYRFPDRKLQNAYQHRFATLKGSLTRDFRLQVFCINQCTPGLWVSHWDHFKFFRKFVEIFVKEYLSAVSTTPAKKDKNFEIKFFKIFC